MVLSCHQTLTMLGMRTALLGLEFLSYRVPLVKSDEVGESVCQSWRERKYKKTLGWLNMGSLLSFVASD